MRLLTGNRFQFLKNNLKYYLIKKYWVLFKTYLYLRSFLNYWIYRFYLEHYSLSGLALKSEHMTYLITYFRYSTVYQMQQLVDMTVIDLIGKRYRWILVYNFLSVHYNLRYMIYLPVDEFRSVLTITACFKNAFWLEREVWDMFGLFFLGHVGLRRILTEYGFRGHPLRKDFPLTGYYEHYYHEAYKIVIKTKVSLAQEFRVYIFHNVWNKNYMGLHQKFQKKDTLLNL